MDDPIWNSNGRSNDSSFVVFAVVGVCIRLLLNPNLFLPIPDTVLDDEDETSFVYAFPNHGFPFPNSRLVMKPDTEVCVVQQDAYHVSATSQER